MKRNIFIWCILLIALENAASQLCRYDAMLIICMPAFIYSRYADSMPPDSPFLGRRNGFALASDVLRNTIVVGYGTPVNPSLMVLQRYPPPELNSFPPQPRDTLFNSTTNQEMNMPNREYSVLAALLDDSRVIVASQTTSAMGLSIWAPNTNETDPEMEFIYFTWIYWGDPEIQGSTPFTFLDASTYLTSIAVMSSGASPKVAVAVRFDAVFRVLIFDVADSGIVIDGVVESRDDFTAISMPDLIPFRYNGQDNLLLSYSHQLTTTQWKIQISVINSTYGVKSVASSEVDNIPNRPAQIKLNLGVTGSQFFYATVNAVNLTATSLRQAVIDATGTSSTTYELFSRSSLASLKYATALLSNGQLITIWIDVSDTQNIHGQTVDYTKDDPPFKFTIPAATSTLKIDELSIAPMFGSTFAITQVVRGVDNSTFVNFYVVSDCADSIRTPNENCEAGQPGCVNCMCSEQTGWYSNGDDTTCFTSCADGIIAGDENCFNMNDTNCVGCVCINGLVFNPETSFCELPVPQSSPNGGVTTPSAPILGPPPFEMGLIAVFVCVPVAVGLAIFFGVYFGRKNAKKGAKGKSSEANPRDDVPLADRKYSSIASLSTIPSSTTNASESRPTGEHMRTIDRLNVPYTELKFNKEIGAGAYGKVYIGEWQRTKVALKINTLATGDEFEQEAKLMVDLRPHPNVVQMLGVSSDGPYPVMILEFCDGGSLDTKLFDPTQPMTAADQLKIVSGIAKGLYHLHKNQIVHRDLAARNILLNFNQPKISDFGLSRLVNDSQKGTTRSNVGPIRWMAPESLKSKSYSTKSDVWSFGIVVYEIAARTEPHAEADAMAIGLQIRDHGATPSIPEGCDPCLKELMEKCWDADPENRPSMEQICDILDKYLEKNNL